MNLFPSRKIEGRTPHCPSCGHKLDGVAACGEHDATPKVGDVTVCIACNGILVFKVVKPRSVILRKATPEELQEFLRDPIVTTIRVTNLQVHRKLGRDLA